MAVQGYCHRHRLRFQLLLFIFCILVLIAESEASTEDDRKVYIVYMGDSSQGQDGPLASSFHKSMLNDVIGRHASEYLLHSYSRSFHGFSAKLTREEVQKLTGMERVVSVFPSQKHKLHTTRSWDFLGLPLNVRRSSIESDTIIGVFDTGVWPELESFSDKGYGPPPRKWKGICQGNFSCNNKIIGARYYKSNGDFKSKDLRSPRDSEGHGTHTASTAAGNIVQKASFEGIRLGTARGGVPRARIAVYKVCWDGGCADDDFLAAFDDAIADGVDIISISAGSTFSQDYLSDGIAIGSFHAIKKGILTSQSANNEGPNPQTTSSTAPWVLSVAASTMENKLVTPVKLGNNIVYKGVSINAFKLTHKYPLISGEDAPNTKAGFDKSSSRFCIENSLNPEFVKGKVVFCEARSDGTSGLLAGASGLLMTDNTPFSDLPSNPPLPAANLDQNVSTEIINYIKRTRNATAIIMKSTETRDVFAPYVASFSGRGPNPISNSILKPDLTAPGVAILAAYSPIAVVGDAINADNRSASYNIISGTSMACPHVSGMATYIKTFHPSWSPAAIKSALMTTASSMSRTMNVEAEFAYGAGHANPVKALDPGLIYDANEDDYVMFLCGEGYSTKQVKLVTGNKKSNCSAFRKGAKDLNYPSFVVPTLRNKPSLVKFNRTVTNVGPASSTYQAFVDAPPISEIQIEVKPEILKFHYVGEKLSYEMTLLVKIGATDSEPMISAFLTWSDGVHQVRSPIVVYVPT